MKIRPICFFFCLVATLLGCGGGDSSTSNPATYSIGGFVSGLYVGQQISISNSDVEQIISANGKFQLINSLPKGGSFSISITQKPVGVSCVIKNESGTEVTSNIANVSIQCSKNVCTAAQAVIQGGGAITSDQMRQLEIAASISAQMSGHFDEAQQERMKQTFIQQNLEAARAVIAQQC
jgi:hypothetical protein